MTVWSVRSLPCEHGVLSLSLKFTLKNFNNHGAHSKSQCQGCGERQVPGTGWLDDLRPSKWPCLKIQDEGTKGMQLRLTPGLHMPGFMCAQGPTNMNTLRESVRFPQAFQRQILKADTWCTWLHCGQEPKGTILSLSFKSTKGSKGRARDFQPQKSSKPTNPLPGETQGWDQHHSESQL